MCTQNAKYDKYAKFANALAQVAIGHFLLDSPLERCTNGIQDFRLSNNADFDRLEVSFPSRSPV
jgi:hypothetical protein